MQVGSDAATKYGGIAQLGERLNGIQEVSGSIPLISTKAKNTPSGVFFALPKGKGEPLTSCNKIIGQRHRRGGREAAHAAGGSIPLISTKRKTEDEVPGLFVLCSRVEIEPFPPISLKHAVGIPHSCDIPTAFLFRIKRGRTTSRAVAAK